MSGKRVSKSLAELLVQRFDDLERLVAGISHAVLQQHQGKSVVSLDELVPCNSVHGAPTTNACNNTAAEHWASRGYDAQWGKDGRLQPRTGQRNIGDTIASPP